MSFSHLTPDASILLFSAGLLLLYFELNRPGSVLPGALGLLMTLLAAASIIRFHPRPSALVLIGAAALLLLLDLLRPTPILLSLVAMLALIYGFLHLVPRGNAGPIAPLLPTVHPATAIVCGVALGAGTSVLTRIARRARLNKGLDLELARTSRPGASKS